ncbi:chemotaxis signal transduction protein [Herbaspirillum sp. Sphag1AN]|uniref:chemotaxis protein CheW n=1 Tax=unclassified Herbaspirillum TaxID=2624150 RepID=UPI001615B80B|nr:MULTISPECIES: chemotaxis protein CheW [unclassified Herbaspirillum]MBB3210800.1 chemotaxis signal transduction protein [Herbaspirillum sp. Sphag1AN]MBB3244430.1 chemotaxis signal transduction protein [Herbaspirillum sp. Sphag64]
MTQGRDDGASTLIALVRLETLAFAIPTASLLGAIDCDDGLSALPRRHGAVAGAICYRDEAVAVIDLRLWLPFPKAPQLTAPEDGGGEELVMVLQADGRRVGVLVSKIDGLVSVSPQQIQRICQNDTEEDVFHTVVKLPASPPQSREQAVGLLDVAALMRLSAAWSEIEQVSPTAATDTADVAADVVRRVSMAIVAVGEQTLAIPLDAIRDVEPMPVMKSLPGQVSMLGYAQLHARDIPIIDSAALLHCTVQPPYPFLALLAHEDLWIGLPVTAIKAVQAVDMTQLGSHVDAGFSASLPVRGVLQLPDHGPALVPDVSNLTALYPLGSRRIALLPALIEGKKTAPVQDQPYIVLEAGPTWAVPMAVIDAVAFLDEGVEWLPGASPARAPVARMRYRQGTIALWDLYGLCGGTTALEPPDKVVIVSVQGRLLGLLVRELRQLLPIHSCDILTLHRNKEGPVQLLQPKLAGTRSNYQILNLDAYPALKSSSQ